MKEAAGRAPTIVYIVTSGLSLALLKGQLEFVRQHGFHATLIAGDEPPRDWLAGQLSTPQGDGILVVPMVRAISPLRDLVSIFRLWSALRRLRPDIVNVSTPKAGLLGGIAAFLARVPCRLYLLRGLRFETARGPRRWLLQSLERLSCSLAHRVLAVGASLRQRAIETGIVSARRIEVLAHGSSNGVDIDRFRPENASARQVLAIRQRLQIPEGAVVLGFIGRITRDKGIPELLTVFETLRGEFPSLHLLLVGGFESGDAIDADTRDRLLSSERVIRCGFVTDVADYFRIVDILVLPTHREGFPNVVLEAQAAGLPVVTTQATGASDSIRDGVTGFAVPVGDIPAMAQALRRLIADPELRRTMGGEGRQWIAACYRREIVWEALLAHYRSMLRSRRRPGALFLKRFLDLLVALPALILLSPLIGFLALLVLLFLGRPVLFAQERPGLHGRPFLLRKFRTMDSKTGPDGKLLSDVERLTPFGRFLRASSLDELPQLFNVVCGEMSLVGPRPLLMEYLERYTPEQARRHEVVPGITGWSQVNGRNAIDWDQKLALDIWYVDHCTLALDIKILWLTVLKVVRRDGISSQGHVTMPEFKGKPTE